MIIQIQINNASMFNHTKIRYSLNSSLFDFYMMIDRDLIQQQLETTQLAGHIYTHQRILVLQEPLNSDGSTFNMFIQHDQTADQLGFQFAVEVLDQQLNLLIGVTHSNQDRSYEISAGNLKGDQKAFNLCYAFYNYPKQFFLVRSPLDATNVDFESELKTQLFEQAAMAFLNTAIKTTEDGIQQFWMKHQIFDLCVDMKQRLSQVLIH